MLLASVENQELTGTFNASSPNPVPNAEFMRALRRALHRPWSPPVPEFAARIGSYLMGTEVSLALVSQRCVPKRFLENAFNFEFPTLREALTNIFPSQ
jgi:NAD dependent epimerase/dehydratase family enzyme